MSTTRVKGLRPSGYCDVCRAITSRILNHVMEIDVCTGCGTGKPFPIKRPDGAPAQCQCCVGSAALEVPA